MTPVGVHIDSKKWKKPKNTVIVSLGSRWENPFDESKGDFNFETSFSLFRTYALEIKDKIKKRLAGKNLACTCPIGTRCHRDILLEIANS